MASYDLEVLRAKVRAVGEMSGEGTGAIVVYFAEDTRNVGQKVSVAEGGNHASAQAIRRDTEDGPKIVAIFPRLRPARYYVEGWPCYPHGGNKHKIDNITVFEGFVAEVEWSNP